MYGSDSVFQKRCIMVTLILNDRACRQDRLRVLLIMCQTITKELESLKVLAYTDVQKSYRCQNFTILWRKLQAFEIHLDRTLVVLLDLEHSAKFDVGVFVLMDRICLSKVGNSFVIDT